MKAPQEIPAPDFAALPVAQLARMKTAGEAMILAQQRLEKAGHDLVGRAVGGNTVAVPWDHYPADDVHDLETASQYYFHSHGTGDGLWPAEIGHFHLFLLEAGLRPDAQPRLGSSAPQGCITHLVAISMDRRGLPLGLFTTNAWVTNENFYPAKDILPVVCRFGVDHTHPCLALNQWLTSAVDFFEPQIAALLEARDLALADLAHPDGWSGALKNREIEVVSFLPVAPEAQMREILALLAKP